VASSDRARSVRAAFVAIAVGATITSSSCGDFERTNPFDPAVPVTLTIQGPDSSFAQFDTLRFTVTTDPVYDHDPPEWGIGPLRRIANDGRYEVGAIELFGGRSTKMPITVRIGPRTATKVVDVTFQPVTFRARICDTDAREIAFSALGNAGVVCTVVLDKRGGLIGRNLVDAPPFPLVARALDNSVVTVGQFVRAFTTVGNGSTAVVYTYGPLADTVTVTVRQEVAGLTPQPSSCSPNGIKLTVGQNVQLSAGAPGYDGNQRLVADQAEVQRVAASVRWSVVGFTPWNAPVVPASATSDGLVTAMGEGWATVLGTTVNAGRTISVYCFVNVT